MADDKTPEQLLEEAKVAQQAAQAAIDKARADFLAPLRAIVSRPSFKTIMDDLNEVAPTYAGDPGFAHIHGVASIMPRLKEWLDKEPHPEAD